MVLSLLYRQNLRFFLYNKKIETDDLFAEIAYNSSSRIHEIFDEKVITMDNSVLTCFFSKLPDFYKYAPKEMLETFCDEFVAQFTDILKNYDEEKMLCLLDEWFDTVDIYSNSELTERLQNIDSEIEKGLYSEWNSKEHIG
ncbi:MAG: hypothetical protein J6M02_06575 [Clostridia bacterium]|nr:hypothetical protein [Clostridia bacterium]